MTNTRVALATAQWVSGAEYDYGADDAGYYGDEHRNHVVRGTFAVRETDGVRLQIASLGYRTCRVNGLLVSDEELCGDWTRFDKLVYFDEYDLSALVRPGENVIEIELGNGWYNPSPLTLFGKYNLRERLAEVGTPAVLVAVTRGEELLARSDETWTYTLGQLTFNNVYLGERRDLTLTAGGPMPVVARENTRELERGVVPRCRQLGRERAVRIEQREGGVLVDVGRIVAGFVDLRLRSREGQVVTMTFAEVVDDNDEPNYDTNLAGLVGLSTPRGMCPGGPGAPELAYERDVVTCVEGESRFTSQFCTHSFRYVWVEGVPAEDILSIEGIYVHSDVTFAGTLETGDAFLDELLDAARRTKLNNIHGIWEDCARERLGYGGDMVALFSSNAYLYDAQGLLDKTLADFRRDQTERGGMPETAPFMGIGSEGPAYGEGPLLWQLAYPYLALQADRWYGRRDLLEREWPSLRRMADYVLSFDPVELARHCLGDHGSVLSQGFGGTPDKELCGWCAILWILDTLRQIAERLGEEAGDVLAAEESLRAQIVDRFRHEDGSFGDGTQTAYAFAAALGLGDAAELTVRLAARIREDDGVLSCGIFGTVLAFDLLHRYGFDDVAEAWLTSDGDPSFRRMLASGSGVLAEEFHAFLSSYDHAMFSSYVQWMYQALGGISIADDAVAANRIVVAPFFSKLTDHVRCAYRTPQGELVVEWRRTDGVVELEVDVPAGTEVALRCGDVVEPLPAADEVRRARSSARA